MLGFNTDFAKATRHSAFGSVETKFIMSEVTCNGTEDSIEDCEYKQIENYTTDVTTSSPAGQNDCGSKNGAGVFCYGMVFGITVKHSKFES